MTDKEITTSRPFKILFVCLGNICRSPTAEGLFQHIVKEHNLDSYFYIDSAGTSAWHIGEPANSKSRKIAGKYGVELNSRARRFEPADFDEFDLIIAMDEDNYRNLQQLARSDQDRAKIRKMREFDPDPGDGNVPDPYYGGIDGFENVFKIIKRSSEGILEPLKEKIRSTES